jgi:hypothetical protein
MNKAKLKTYAPQARKDFIAAVTARANLLGLSDSGGRLEVATGERKGDIAIIAGMEWSAKVYELRERLIKRMTTEGFSHTVDAIAYTWFNRFAALRYMEIHDYLDHGYRALSNREGGMPEILNHATELDLPGLNKDRAVELKLAGDKDGELYKMLLVAQCNALSRSMPFLFEHIDDETELLLADNLLRTDSVIAKLVAAIPEEDWQEVEIIGWLYQFYISEKKDEVIGKVVKSEDIPAATQLFTPNWIVKYLVQNSVGRLWLMANPASTLKSEWAYYIEPAKQTPEVQAQLDALIQARIQQATPLTQGEGQGERVGETLNPETITMLDPACGSGHILVEAYEVLKGIYLERGYRLRDIPRLILEKNLFGLDIDDRAAQLAGFALLMKARADDRRLLDNPPKLNVLALQESSGLDADVIVRALNTVRAADAQAIRLLIDSFAHAKTFGSLIQIPPNQNVKLASMAEYLQQAIKSGDLYAESAAQQLLPLVVQARVLGMQFDAVVANPPYMGGKYLTQLLKEYLVENYKGFEKDLFSAFISRNMGFTNKSGQLGFMSPMVWMFISSHEELRLHVLNNSSVTSLIQLEYNASGDVRVPLCVFCMARTAIEGHDASFIRLTAFPGEDVQRVKTLEAIKNPNCGWFHKSKPSDFKKISGSPFAYWLGDGIFRVINESAEIKTVCDARQGLSTGDTNRFIRFWFEVPLDGIAFGCKSAVDFHKTEKSWAPYNKGGEFRKYYGNLDYVVLWKNHGEDLKSFTPKSVIRNETFFFKSSISWSDVTSSHTSFRHYPEGFIFDTVGHSAFFANDSKRLVSLGYLNGNFIQKLIPAINPTLHFSGGYFSGLPYLQKLENTEFTTAIQQCIDIAIQDWNSHERSWDYLGLPFINGAHFSDTLDRSWTLWSEHSSQNFFLMKKIEEENNRHFIQAYALQNELSPAVPEEKITLTRADREKDCQRLISYAIGCMMGRYSLDEPSLIYAHAGNIGFDATRYQTFPADADGIVPLTDELWFEDDAANRIREFLLSVWGAETLNENMAWLAESLGIKGNETPEETIRRYLASSFFKNHLQTYKKRPIYWLFSSGKQGAFQALVYLHRYHEGTLARMRAEYVVPLTSKIQSRIEMLEKDAAVATVTSARNKINKEIEVLRKKHVELLAYDEKLRHYADMRIQLDLDDGVKVNYGKFGDLLSELKAVTGEKDGE